MRIGLALTAMLALGLGFAKAEGDGPGAKEEAILVKITDFDKAETYSVLSGEDLKNLDAEIKTETRLHTPALTNAEREWRKDENMRNKMFPRGKINPRKFAVIAKYKDMEQAEERKTALEEQAEDKVLREKERDADRQKAIKGVAGNKGKPGAVRPKSIEKDLVLEQAVGLYKTKLDELKTAPPQAPQGQEAGKAPAAAKDAGKAE